MLIDRGKYFTIVLPYTAPVMQIWHYNGLPDVWEPKSFLTHKNPRALSFLRYLGFVREDGAILFHGTKDQLAKHLQSVLPQVEEVLATDMNMQSKPGYGKPARRNAQQISA